MGSNYNFLDQVHGQGHIFGDYGRQENRFKTSPQTEEPHRLIEELIQEIRAYASQLPDPDELTSTAGQLQTELSEDEPNQGTLRRLLTNITLGAAGVTAVAEAVDKLREALNLGG
jgi:Family of unknown function (DUF5955)